MSFGVFLDPRELNSPAIYFSVIKSCSPLKFLSFYFKGCQGREHLLVGVQTNVLSGPELAEVEPDRRVHRLQVERLVVGSGSPEKGLRFHKVRDAYGTFQYPTQISISRNRQLGRGWISNCFLGDEGDIRLPQQQVEGERRRGGELLRQGQVLQILMFTRN